MPNAIRAQRRAHRLALGAKVALEQRRLEPLLHGVALGVGQELKHSHQLVRRQVVAVGAARRLLKILDLLHLRRDALELRHESVQGAPGIPEGILDHRRINLSPEQKRAFDAVCCK